MTVDWIAVYAAALSTILAGAEFWKWLASGPSAAVLILNPLDVRRFDNKLYELVVSNNGTVPIVIQSVRVSVHEKKNTRKALESVTFDTHSAWNPALRSIPHPTKSNSWSSEANVIAIGHEVHQALRPFKAYDPTKHWVKAVVSLRNSTRSFTAWASPSQPLMEAI